jgi:hypothetical protein
MATITGTPINPTANGSTIFGKIFNWIQHPTFDTKTDPKDWLAGLVLIVIAAFLWSRVVKQLVEN